MKLVISIIHDEDVNKAITGLNSSGFSVTKLATTGGFLRAGNVTLLVGVDEDKVDNVIKIFESTCSARKKIMISPMSVGMAEIMSNRPIEVDAGGATIFVIDVDKFEKI